MDHLQAVNTLATERYLLGEMAEEEQQAFEAHYFDCLECAEDVRAGALMTDGVRAGLLRAPKVAELRAHRTAAHPWRRSLAVAIPRAAAAALALVAGYQSLVRSPAAPPLADPVALAPITLRPASRGEEAVVTLPAGAAGATLAVDLASVNATGSLHYELRRANGGPVASGTVPAPEAGSPLLLLVPARLLTPAEHYVLTLNDSLHAALTSGGYRFTVEAR